MGIGTSIFLIALGAILAFAVHARVSGIDVNTLGVILMVVGALGGVLSLMYWNSWGGNRLGGGGFGANRVYRRERTVVHPSPVVQAAPVVPAAPVAGTPVVASGMPVAGAGVPVVGQGVPVVGRSVPVERTTVYEDRI